MPPRYLRRSECRLLLQTFIAPDLVGWCRHHLVWQGCHASVQECVSGVLTVSFAWLLASCNMIKTGQRLILLVNKVPTEFIIFVTFTLQYTELPFEKLFLRKHTLALMPS